MNVIIHQNSVGSILGVVNATWPAGQFLSGNNWVRAQVAGCKEVCYFDKTDSILVYTLPPHSNVMVLDREASYNPHEIDPADFIEGVEVTYLIQNFDEDWQGWAYTSGVRDEPKDVFEETLLECQATCMADLQRVDTTLDLGPGCKIIGGIGPS